MPPRGPKRGSGVSGGAEVGKLGGRPPQIAERAYAVQQATASAKAREKLTEGEIVISIAALRAAIKDLETEAIRRRSRPMIAVEISLTTGTWYIPLPSWNDGRSVRLPMGGGERVLTPGDVRANWDAWVSDLVDEAQLLTREQLDADYPGIVIDHE